MQERINEYRHMNEMLSLQLEERTQDVELLESRINDSSRKSNQFSLSQNVVATPEGFTLSQSNQKRALSDDSEDDEPEMDYKKEFKKATATLAEQLITIQNLERVIAEDNQMVESLTSERTKLTQKLSLMQQIKAEYDNQTAEYEKLLARNKELENGNSQPGGGEDVDDLKEQLSSQKMVVSQLQEALKTMANQKSDIQKSMSGEGVGIDISKQQQLEELQKQLDALQAENSRLNSSYKGHESVEEDYVARIQQLESALTNFSTQREQMVSQIQQYRDMIEDLEDAGKSGHAAAKTLAQADAEMDFLQSEFDQKLQQISVLEKKINVMEEDHAKEIHRIKSVASIEASGIAPLPTSNATELLLSETQDELARLVSKLDAKERELEELRAKTVNFSNLGNNDNAVNDQYQISLYKQEIESKTKEIERLHEELDLMEERLTPFYDAQSTEHSRRPSRESPNPVKFGSSIKLASNEEKDKLVRELQDCRDEIEDLHLRLDHAQEHISRLEAAAVDSYDSSELKNKFQNLVNEHSNLLEDLKNMEAAHVAELEVLKARNAQNSNHSEDIETLQAKISNLELQLAKTLENENREVERLTGSFQEQLDERLAEIESLENTIESLTTQLSDLEKSSMDIVAQQDSSRAQMEKTYQDSIQKKQAEIEKLKIPVNFLGKGSSIDRKKMKATAVKKGKIYLLLSYASIKMAV